MGRLRTNALAVMIAFVSLTLTITPGFGQAGGGLAESRNERLSGAGQAILESAGPGVGGSAARSLAPALPGASSFSTNGITVGTNVRVNAPQQAFPNGLLGRSETTIASDEEGQRLVAGWNDAQGFCGPPFGAACTPQNPSGLSGFGFSTNGGATWTDGGAPDPALGFSSGLGVPVFTRGDPWMAADKDGRTFFYANLAVHAVTGADLGVSVHRGRFSGSTFAWRDVRVFNSPNAQNLCTNPSPPPAPAQIPCDFYDKEAIATDPDDRDNAAVSVTNFQALCGVAQFGFGQIEVWRTRNGGNTWQGPFIAGPEAADSVATCGNAGTLQQSSALAFGDDGELYVTWQFGPTFSAAGVPSTDADIVVARSPDGGKTWDPPVKVADINSMRQAPPVGYNRSRINDHPRIAVMTEGGKEGRVLVVFPSAFVPTAAPGTTQNLTSVNIFLSYSDNGGATWSTPKAIAGSVPPTGVKRFWPVVTVGRDSSSVDVVYQESLEQAVPGAADCNVGIGGGLRRIGPAHSLVNTKLVHSNDSGNTFGPPITVSTATSDWCAALFNIRPNFGDYIGSAAAGDDDEELVLPVWHDSRNGPVDTFFTRVRIGNGSASRPEAPAAAGASPASSTSGVWAWIKTRLSAAFAQRR